MQSTDLSRREALKRTCTALGGLAMPTIVSRSIFGHNAPSNRVNLAAIGVGSRGTDNCGGCFQPLEDVRIVAAADCRKSCREAFARLMNDRYAAKVCTAYSDFRDVLARKDVDGVVISTPDHWHVPLAVYAAQAGKDMYVEARIGANGWSQGACAHGWHVPLGRPARKPYQENQIKDPENEDLSFAAHTGYDRVLNRRRDYSSPGQSSVRDPRPPSLRTAGSRASRRVAGVAH